MYVGGCGSICVSKSEKICFLGQPEGQQMGCCLDKYLFVCLFSNHPICVGESLQVIIAEADIREWKTQISLV